MHGVDVLVKEYIDLNDNVILVTGLPGVVDYSGLHIARFFG